MHYSLCAVTLNVIFCLLNGSDNIRLLHSICVYMHSLGHFSDFIKFHCITPLIFLRSSLSAKRACETPKPSKYYYH